MSFLGPAPQAGPTVAEMRRFVAQDVAEQNRLWGEPGVLSIFRHRLYRCLRADRWHRAIYKVDRVQQPDGQVRFDLFLATAVAKELIGKLKAASTRHAYGWYTRRHVPYADRVGRGASPTAHAQRLARATPTNPNPLINNHRVGPTDQGSLRVHTYNINGVAKKRVELRVFLEQTRCDVLGPQETLLRSTDSYGSSYVTNVVSHPEFTGASHSCPPP